MKMKQHFEDLLHRSIDIWIEEDIGDGDHTTLSTIPENTAGKAELLVKEKGMIAGIFAVKRILHRFDKNVRLNEFISDGAFINPGDIVFEVSGSARTLLQTERLILNVLQRLSGIATETNRYASVLEGYKTKILDTRKTTPGLRLLEKEAVRLGGGENHRFGLFDMILIKDNHIDFAGGIVEAIRASKEYVKKYNKQLKIEIEAHSIEDVEVILNEGGINRILLDNFSPAQTRDALELINGRTETESSGNITLQTLKEYAECGVDYISAGALTHQIKSLDMSLKASYYPN